MSNAVSSLLSNVVPTYQYTVLIYQATDGTIASRQWVVPSARTQNQYSKQRVEPQHSAENVTAAHRFPAIFYYESFFFFYRLLEVLFFLFSQLQRKIRMDWSIKSEELEIINPPKYKKKGNTELRYYNWNLLHGYWWQDCKLWRVIFCCTM